MIVKTFPLVRPGVFVTDFRELVYAENQVIVKPTFLSICAADLRYYFGQRPSHVLQAKLPMTLIHEAIGTVVWSKQPDIPAGAHVILLPCGKKASVDSNYQSGSFFRSSNAEGFCQELMALDPDEVLLISEQGDPTPFVFSELLSVCFQAIRQVENELNNAKTIGVWGDGSLGYLLAYVISTFYKGKEITIIGKHEDKLDQFVFSNKTETIFESGNSKFDLMFECVGGGGAQSAIDNAISRANPKATILLTGVSENPPTINTRSILEKGLTLRGTTRSVRDDFIRANAFLNDPKQRKVVSVLFSDEKHVTNSVELRDAFESSVLAKFKTILRFNP